MAPLRSSSQGARAAIQGGIVLVLAAGLFDAAPLYVPGVAGLVLGLGCLAWVASGARGLRVARRVAATRVVEGDPLAFTVAVTSARVAVPSCVIHDELLSGPVSVRGGRRAAVLRAETRFARRGRQVLAPPAVVVSDPLGLVRQVVLGAVPVRPSGAHAPTEILVLPRTEPLVAGADGSGARGTVTRRARPGVAPAAEVDLDGLRPHREGAPASRIHWPALARTGELIERRLRPEGDTRPLVLLDARGGDRDRLDAAVRAAASLCVHLADLGGCALLLPGDRRPAPLEPGLAGWPHLHARLALVEGGGLPALSGLASRPGAIFYVAATAMARVPPVLAHAPAAGRVLVVPAGDGAGGRRAAFTVAGCVAYDLAPIRRPGARRARAAGAV